MAHLSAVSPEHKAVEHLKFDESKEDFTTSKPRKAQNKVGYRLRWAKGYGTDHISKTAYKLICNRILKSNVREIDLIGFSRGGSIAFNVGALLRQLELDLKGKLPEEDIQSIKVHIYAMDPVAGKSRNLAASKYGEVSHLVKTCIVGLATNESLPGFHPRDILSRMEPV